MSKFRGHLIDPSFLLIICITSGQKKCVHYLDLGDHYYPQKGIFTFACKSSTMDFIPSTILETKILSFVGTRIAGSGSHYCPSS